MIFKLLMYLLSYGSLPSSHKALFNFPTWVCLSCVLTSSGYKCLFVVYAFFSWEASCYEYFLVSHDGTIDLPSSLDIVSFFLNWYSPSLSSWLLIHSWKVLHQWCHYIRHIILHLELSSLVLPNKSHPSFLVGDCMWYFLQVKCISCMVRNIS